MTAHNKNRLEIWLGVASPLLAVAAFFWGIYTYRDAAHKQLLREEADAVRTAEARRIEATRPFLDMQLALYTDLMENTSIIATSSSEERIIASKKRFLELYYGEVPLVEGIRVAKAMAAFKAALDEGATQHQLGSASLQLAIACRDELALSWGTDAWMAHQPIQD